MGTNNSAEHRSTGDRRTTSFFDLPVEVRHHIYSYALTSPTGYVLPAIKRFNVVGIMTYEVDFVKRTYWPRHSWDWIPDSHIALPLLETCKQIYNEARGHFYRQNTLVLHNFHTFEPAYPRLGQWAKHIWINSHLFRKHRTGAKLTASALKVIYGWIAQGGPLQTFTLNLVLSCNGFSHLLEDFENERLRFEEAAALLRDSWGPRFPKWNTVRRKLDLCVGKWKAPAQQNPYPVLNVLHDAYGGELWINGQMCYRNGEEIVRAFERCIVFEHGESLDKWWQMLW